MEGISRFDTLQTKIVLPRRPSHLLTRPRLIDLLYDILDYRLFILAAPAGYGKTSILVDWANQLIDLPICWYAIDELDSEPHRFFTYFIEAISKRFPAFGRQSQITLQNMPKNLDVQRLVHVLVNDAFEHIQDHFVFVLDDYHLINNSPEINTFISDFVQQVDENCHLVLASRTLLSLPDMALMVSRSQASGLGFEELVFKANEIQALAEQNYHVILPSSEAEVLVEETEGWITGVLLSTQPIWQGMATRIRGIRSTGTELYDYMAQQVLDKQPPELRNFLLRTSLLEEFDVTLCKAVLGEDSDYPILMREVQQGNLFVLSVGTDGTWLRYHHLFLQFLQDVMFREYPADYHQILKRLAAVYTEREAWEKAYAIYHRLGDSDAIAQYLAAVGELMVRQGRITLLNQWLDKLPNDKLTAYPSLLSRHGIAAVMAGQTELGLQRLNRAAKALNMAGDYTHLIGCLVWRATAYRFLGDYEAAHHDVDRAMELYKQHTTRYELWAAALRVKGLTWYWQGDLWAAINWLKKSLTEFRELPNRQDEALVLMELGLAMMGTGAYTQALRYYTQALPYWQQGFDPIRLATLLNNVGVLYHLTGQYERAAETLEQAVTTAHECGYVRMEALAYASLGDLYIDLEAFEAAQEAYDQVKPLANQMADRFLIFYMNVAQATLAEMQHNMIQAELYLDGAWEKIKGSQSDFEFGLWYLTAGKCALQDENLAQAKEYLEQAVVRFHQGGQQAENAKAHLYLGMTLALQQENEAAEVHFARAFILSSEVESRNLLIVGGNGLQEMLARVNVSPSVDAQIAELLVRMSVWEKNLPVVRRRLRRRSTAVNFAPPLLVLHALGDPKVYLDNSEVSNSQWQSLAARDTLFCLLAYPEGLSGEGLGALFWPDKPPPQLKLHLKKTLYRLRRALQQNVVLFDENRYHFNFSLDYEYDVELFWQYIGQAQQTELLSDKVKALLRAMDCYQGPYLRGLDEYWVIGERERIWQAYRQAGLYLARYYLNTSAFDLALSFCQRVLDHDPCIEEAYTIAMQVFALRGQHAEVALQYERCRQSLHVELGIQPSPETQLLFKQLIQNSSNINSIQ